MASTMMRPAIVAAGLLAAFWASAPLAADSSPGAAASGENDLREFRVGMGVDQLPKSGYRGFTCADAADRKLQGWEDYGLCPREASGLHAVRFRYDESVNPLAKVNGLYEGTKVAGHPALLTLLISDNARVEGLVIETDPAAPLFLRKKAFLFGNQVKARWVRRAGVARRGSLRPTSSRSAACSSRNTAKKRSRQSGLSLTARCSAGPARN